MTLLKIAMPTNSFLPSLGGVSIGLHNIASRLKKKGHEPTVIAPYSAVSALKRRGISLPYNVTALPPKIGSLCLSQPQLGIALLSRIFKHLNNKYSFDVWHCSYGYPGGAALAHYASKRRVPHLVRCVGIDIQKRSDIGYGFRLDDRVDDIVKQWLPQAQRLVAITDDVGTEYQALNIPEGKIARIPNGVDLQRFSSGHENKAALRQKLGLAENKTILLSLSRFHPKKNFEMVVRIMQTLKNQGRDDIHCVLAGAGMNAILPLVKNCVVADRVSILEQQSSTPDANKVIKAPSDWILDLYRAADIFLFPSLIETFGIVLVEAMAAGLPIITSNGPGCREVIRYGKDGLMITDNDAAAYSESICRVVDTPGLRNDLAKTSLTRAQDFSWDTIVDDYVDLYQTLITEQARNT